MRAETTKTEEGSPPHIKEKADVTMKKPIVKFVINEVEVTLCLQTEDGVEEYVVVDDEGLLYSDVEPWTEQPTEAEVKERLIKWYPAEFVEEEFADLWDEEDEEDRAPKIVVPKPRDL